MEQREITLSLNVIKQIGVRVCVHTHTHTHIQSGPKNVYTLCMHFVYTLPSVLETTILLQPCWVTVLTIKDISACAIC